MCHRTINDDRYVSCRERTNVNVNVNVNLTTVLHLACYCLDLSVIVDGVVWWVS